MLQRKISRTETCATVLEFLKLCPDHRSTNPNQDVQFDLVRTILPIFFDFCCNPICSDISPLNKNCIFIKSVLKGPHLYGNVASHIPGIYHHSPVFHKP